MQQRQLCPCSSLTCIMFQGTLRASECVPEHHQVAKQNAEKARQKAEREAEKEQARLRKEQEKQAKERYQLS